MLQRFITFQEMASEPSPWNGPDQIGPWANNYFAILGQQGPRPGSKAALVQQTGWIMMPYSSPQAVALSGARLRVLSGYAYLVLEDSAGDPLAAVRIDPAGGYTLLSGGGSYAAAGYPWGSAPTTIGSGQLPGWRTFGWNYVHLEAGIDASAGYVKLTSRGQTVADVTGLNTLGSYGSTVYALRATADNSGGSYLLADVYLADTTGSALNTTLPDLACDAIPASGPGVSTAMVPQGGAGFDPYISIGLPGSGYASPDFQQAVFYGNGARGTFFAGDWIGSGRVYFEVTAVQEGGAPNWAMGFVDSSSYWDQQFTTSPSETSNHAAIMNSYGQVGVNGGNYNGPYNAGIQGRNNGSIIRCCADFDAMLVWFGIGSEPAGWNGGGSAYPGLTGGISFAGLVPPFRFFVSAPQSGAWTPPLVFALNQAASAEGPNVTYFQVTGFTGLGGLEPAGENWQAGGANVGRVGPGPGTPGVAGATAGLVDYYASAGSTGGDVVAVRVKAGMAAEYGSFTVTALCTLGGDVASGPAVGVSGTTGTTGAAGPAVSDLLMAGPNSAPDGTTWTQASLAAAQFGVSS